MTGKETDIITEKCICIYTTGAGELREKTGKDFNK